MDVRASEDAALVATGGGDGVVRVWDPAAGTELVGLRGHRGHVLRCRFASARLVSSGVDGTVRIWALEPGREAVGLRLHDGPVRAFVLGPSGALLVSGGEDGRICVAELTTGSVVSRIPFTGRVSCLAGHPRRPLVACGGDGGLFHLLEPVGLAERW